MRRPRLIPLAALVLLLAAPSAAQAADVTVNFARGGGSKTVSLDSLSGSFDVNAKYALVGPSGKTTTTQIQGISLRALLDAVDADPTYSRVTIARPSGDPVRVTRAQIEGSGIGPVFYDDGGRATFVRPSYFSSDENAGDVISGSPLVVTQVDDSDFALKAKASKTNPKTSESVAFSATATGAAGQRLTYKWNFNDGSTATGAKVSHNFKKRGYYRVLVTVRGEGESASSASVLKIQVGKAVKSDKQREGGGNNNSAGAPVSGRADGTSGSGDSAGSADAARSQTRRAKKQSRPQQSPEAAQTVTGELLTSIAQPPQQNALAARSGQQNAENGSSGGIPSEAAGAAGALALLGLGVALEMGWPARFSRASRAQA
ncbi:MAG: PKD domain-containing protein [Thermoleophilaceae bacterium]|nr:PKD domain-containing protein [Thermoleophilaceae bacterium]